MLTSPRIQLCLLLISHFTLGILHGSPKDISQELSTSQQAGAWFKRDTPSDKYFHESSFSSHYDARYGREQLQYYNQRSHLSSLIRAYLSTMMEIGAETWLMHGSLLGWYWNRRIMPWDSDLDVQITEKSMQHLANYYNMTVHHFDLPFSRGSRAYMLEINPNWINDESDDVNNKIDARWLDMTTGLYVDITVLRWDREAESSGRKGAVRCKDRHRYVYTDIFPLRNSTFEGMPAMVPFSYANVLVEEYGSASLSNPVHANHRFDPALREWLPMAGHKQEQQAPRKY